MASSGPTDSVQLEKDATDLLSPENYCFVDSLFDSRLISSDDDLLKDNLVYSMEYGRIGKCFIFNHTEYRPTRPELNLEPRSCGVPDAERLRYVFQELHFDVKIFLNLCYDEIIKALSEVNTAGFDNYGCFVCCIMTHGNENGVLWAYDEKYNLDDVLNFFSSEKCPTLAKKPKIFILQVCRGKDRNFGRKVSYCRESAVLGDDLASLDFDDSIDLDGVKDVINLIPNSPIYSDFLTVYSTYEGFFSFKNEHESYFITAFCKKLGENHKKLDLVSILTLINFEIAYNFESCSKDPSLNKLKQMPCFDSSLTKWVRFP